MVIQVVLCRHCGSDQLVKNGFAPNGKQKYLCRACKKQSRENPSGGYSQEAKDLILRAYQERSSMRGISRTFGISRNTLAAWLKKG
jgi:transposase-like protein